MDFYYSRKELRKIFIISLIIFAISLAITLTACNSVTMSLILMLFPTLFVVATIFILLFPQRLARIDERGIQIDHAVPLLWIDVVQARKIKAKVFCGGREAIVFDLKPRVVYPLTFMQNLCKNSEFTSFSIPLYAMEEKDKKAICEEIMKYCKLD